MKTCICLTNFKQQVPGIWNSFRLILLSLLRLPYFMKSCNSLSFTCLIKFILASGLDLEVQLSHYLKHFNFTYQLVFTDNKQVSFITWFILTGAFILTIRLFNFIFGRNSHTKKYPDLYFQTKYVSKEFLTRMQKNVIETIRKDAYILEIF